jgi:hypothetical protein
MKVSGATSWLNSMKLRRGDQSRDRRCVKRGKDNGDEDIDGDYQNEQTSRHRVCP